MPKCHEARGLAGQHHFGACHGMLVVLLRLFKIFLSVFLGSSALTLLDALPMAVPGIMLRVITGLELVGAGVSMLFECVRKETYKGTIIAAWMEEASCGGNTADQKVVLVNSKSILRKNVLIFIVTDRVIVALK